MHPSRTTGWTLALLLLGAGRAGSAARRPRPQKPAPPRVARPAPPPTGAAARVRIPPLQYSDERLPNGLRVLLSPDPAAPTVSVCIGYHVGGKDDPPGRSGFAHLFEHMMFKGSANTDPETMGALTEDVGGFNNAATAPDVTYYFDLIPSNYLEPVLWAEADRMAALNIKEEEFRTEREVVLREYGQRILGDPYGPLALLSDREVFKVHPYGRGSIGTPEALNAATLDEVRAFHAAYYRPDNAVLAVVGDFDAKQVREWVGRYFGKIPAPSAPVPRVRVKEPPQTGERRSVRYAPNVPLPVLSCIYRTGPAVSRDSAVLEVLAGLLATGQSALLYQSLVYNAPFASTVSASSEDREDYGRFTLSLGLYKDMPYAKPLAALDREILRLQSRPVSAYELNRAKAQLLTALVTARESALSRAAAFVGSALLQGDPNRANTDWDDIQAVTPQDIQRAARTYLRPANRAVLVYLPESMRPKNPPKKPAAKGKK